MAKIKSAVFEEASGKLGKGLVVRQTVHGAILAKAPKKASQPRRSEDQARNRGQLANIGSNHRLYDGRLVMSYENKPTCRDSSLAATPATWWVCRVPSWPTMWWKPRVAPCCRRTMAPILLAPSTGPVGHWPTTSGSPVAALPICAGKAWASRRW